MRVSERTGVIALQGRARRVGDAAQESDTQRVSGVTARKWRKESESVMRCIYELDAWAELRSWASVVLYHPIPLAF